MSEPLPGAERHTDLPAQAPEPLESLGGASQEPTAAEAADEPAGEPGEQRTRRGFFGELPVLVLIAFVLALLLKTFLVQAFFIPSSSMEPTLLEQDRVLVNKLAYRFREPRRGEIIVFTKRDAVPELEPVEPATPLSRVADWIGGVIGFARSGERDFIKRIIGMPGETLEMRDGVVYVDDEPLPEEPTGEGGYLSMRDLEDYGPYEVPTGHYFMMGDNRPNSADSRFPSLGMIPAEDVIGRAFVVIWPFDRLGLLQGAEYEPAAQQAAERRMAPVPSAP